MESAPKRLAGLREKHRTVLAEYLMKDPCEIVRHEAAFVMAENFFHIEDSADILIKALEKETSILVKHEIALSLAKFPSVRAIKTLCSLVRDSSVSVSNSAEFALVEMFFNLELSKLDPK